MSNEQLKHIFDDSVCLTRRQMKDYVGGTMTNEESHAVELHLNSCPFCNEAIEGLFEQKEGNAISVLTELDTEFLKDHFSLHHPEIHLNALAAAHPSTGHIHYHTAKRKNAQPFWRNISIAAALLLGISIFWYMKEGSSTVPQQKGLADAQTATTPVEKPAYEEHSTQPIADNTITNKEITNTPEVKLKEDAPMPPGTNGSGSQSPQTLLMAEKPSDKEKETLAAATPAVQTDREDVVVNEYKAPPVNKPSLETKNISAERIEKMPARSTADIANTSAGTYSNNEEIKTVAARANQTAYTVNDAKAGNKKFAPAEDNITVADNLYRDRKYTQALNVYKKELNSSDKRRRAQASLMTARCYLALGQKSKATKVLEDLVQNGSGAPKREARKMLNDISEE